MDASNPMAESHMDCNFVFIECMVGDVNMFLSKDEDGLTSHCCAEIEIMIAGRKEGERGRGRGEEGERERERGREGGGRERDLEGEFLLLYHYIIRGIMLVHVHK